MKKSSFYIMFFLVLLSVTLSSWLFFRSGKICYVNSVKLFSNYKGALKAKTEYEKKLEVWKANIDTLESELKAEVSKYQKSKTVMTAKEKKLSEELIRSKQQQFENYKNAISDNAVKEDQMVTAQVNREISDFLKSYGEQHGYDFILGAATTGNIVYAATGKDITDDVLKKINEEYTAR